MDPKKVIGIHQISTKLGSVSVVLTRNDCGTVAGQCLLGETERPIIDGETEQDVLATFRDVLDELMMARAQWGASKS